MKRKMKSSKLLIILITASLSLSAQYPSIQGLFNNVPQSKYYNAGHFPTDYKGYFGFPLLTNISTTASNSGFAMKDIYKDGNIDLDQLVNTIDDKNLLNVGFGIDVIGFGFSVKDNYFSFNITPKVDFNFGYNKNLLGFIIEGNGGSIGKELSFDGTGFDISAYTEIGFGYTRKVNDKLSAGGRMKILLGVANLSGNFDGVSIYTDPDDFSITANSTFSINMYGSHLANDSLATAWGASNVNFNNLGLGVDFGASYTLNDQLTVFANVVDLGFLSWKDFGERLYNDGASFTYDGLAFDELMSDDEGDSNDPEEEEDGYFERLSDSLSETFSLEKERLSYTTSLKTKVFLGGNYKFNKYFNADGLLYGRFYAGKLYTSAQVGLGVQLGKWFNLKGSYGITNGTYDNLGAGVVFTLGGFQLYTMFDNLYGVSRLDYTRNLTASFGINFLIKGDDDQEKSKKSKKSRKSEEIEIPVAETSTIIKDSAVVEKEVLPVVEETEEIPTELESTTSDSVVAPAVELPSVVDTVKAVLSDTTKVSALTDSLEQFGQAATDSVSLPQVVQKEQTPLQIDSTKVSPSIVSLQEDSIPKVDLDSGVVTPIAVEPVVQNEEVKVDVPMVGDSATISEDLLIDSTPAEMEKDSSEALKIQTPIIEETIPVILQEKVDSMIVE